MKKNAGRRIIGAALAALFLTAGSGFSALADQGSQTGPGFEAAVYELSMGPSAGRNYGPGYGPGMGGNYGIRFAPEGLALYGNASEAEEPLSTLPAETELEVMEGPYDTFARVRVPATGQEGYVKFAYLKQKDAIVNDSDLYTYEEMEQDIWQLRERYSGKLRVEINGTTPDGRNIYQLIMGGSSGKKAKKTILIHAGIHAREYLNCKMVMEQLEQCLENWDNGSYHGRSYGELFSGVEVHVIPMVNPDGIAISQYGENGIKTEEILNIVRDCYAADLAEGRGSADYSVYLSQWKANGRGVDLNKNFPVNFGAGTCPSHPSYASYPGPSAASEPESQILQAITESCSPYLVLNYHSMGQVIYWDLAESAYRERNQEFASFMSGLTGYQLITEDTSSGGYLDWLMMRESPVYTVTLETGSVACPMPASEYGNVWTKNWNTFLAAADFALSH